MAVHYAFSDHRIKIDRLPKVMCQFSKKMKIYQPKYEEPILMGWFTNKHKRWLEDQEPLIIYHPVFVDASRFMKTSRWDGYVYRAIFPSIDLLVMFILTFR